jgi:hypothetical protein
MQALQQPPAGLLPPTAAQACSQSQRRWQRQRRQAVAAGVVARKAAPAQGLEQGLALPQHRLDTSCSSRLQRATAVAAAAAAGDGSAVPQQPQAAAGSGSGFARVVLPTAFALLLCNMDRICLRCCFPRCRRPL